MLGAEVSVDFLKHPQPVEVDGDILGEAQRVHAVVHPSVLRVNVYGRD
jgi:diacylglycerol kinase family enzyme